MMITLRVHTYKLGSSLVLALVSTPPIFFFVMDVHGGQILVSLLLSQSCNGTQRHLHLIVPSGLDRPCGLGLRDWGLIENILQP